MAGKKNPRNQMPFAPSRGKRGPAKDDPRDQMPFPSTDF